MYIPAKNEIVLYDEITFFHELAHAAHHRIRPLKSGQAPFQAIVAETCAAVLCLMYGCEGYVVDQWPLPIYLVFNIYTVCLRYRSIVKAPVCLTASFTIHGRVEP